MVPKSDHLANTAFDKKPPAQAQTAVSVLTDHNLLRLNDSSLDEDVQDALLNGGYSIGPFGLPLTANDAGRPLHEDSPMPSQTSNTTEDNFDPNAPDDVQRAVKVAVAQDK